MITSITIKAPTRAIAPSDPITRRIRVSMSFAFSAPSARPYERAHDYSDARPRREVLRARALLSKRTFRAHRTKDLLEASNCP
jgi:hypothetical protein